MQLNGRSFQSDLEPVHLLVEKTLYVMEDMGSRDPEYDLSALQVVRYDKQGEMHRFTHDVLGVPNTALGFQTGELIGLRKSTQGREETTLLHELQHYVDTRRGMDVQPEYYDIISRLAAASYIARIVSPKLWKLDSAYRKEPLELRAKAAENNPSYRGVLLHT